MQLKEILPQQMELSFSRTDSEGILPAILCFCKSLTPHR